MRKLKPLLAGILLLFSYSPTFSQEIVVMGNITSEDKNQPLPSVTILNKNTGKNTISNDAGSYSIKAVPGHVLQFSYIGYETKDVKVVNQHLDVKLTSKNAELSDVIVTGYGARKNKRELAYQAPTVSGDELAQTRRGNFLNSLAGRIPGLTVTSTSGLPGASAQIMLRGGVSIGGNNQPLFVVDGVPMDNSSIDQESMVSGSSTTGTNANLSMANRSSDFTNRIADINPEDIESVTVLKGPEATSIYGSDGAAGAIVITTKKGSSGQPKINYTNSFSSSEVYRFPDLQTTYTRGNNGIFDPTSYSTLYGYRFFGPRYAEGTPMYDNIRNFFQKAFSHQHNLTLEAGSQDFNYRLSTGYLKQGGVVPNTDYQRMNFRIAANARLNKVFNVSSSWAYIFSDNTKATKGPGSFYSNLMTFPRDIDARDYANPDGSRKIFRAGISPENELDSPFWEVNKNRSYDENDRLTGNLNITAAVAKGLTITGIMGLDQYSGTGYLFYHPQSRSAYTLRGFLTTYAQEYRGLNGTLRASYRSKMGERFTGDLNIGGFFDDALTKTNSGRGERLYEPEFISVNNSDPVSRDAKLTTKQIRKTRFFGGYTLGYDNLIYLSVTGTREGVSTLTSKFYDKQPFFNYGSVSASFIISDLQFMKDISWLSYAKLRASYASTGKSPLSPYIIDRQFTGSNYTGGGFALHTTGSNPNLTPEMSNNMEFGGEFHFLKSRITIDVAYFNNRVNNQIIANRLSYATGHIIKFVNGGSLAANGWEIQLTGTPVKSKKFNWKTIVNFDKAKTVVREMPGDLPFYYDSDTWVFGDVRSQLGKGNSLGNLAGQSFKKNAKGQLLISPTTGYPIATGTGELVQIGDRTPDFKIGLINTFDLNSKWSLSFNLDIRKGGDVFNGNEMMMTLMGVSKRTLDREIPRVIEGVLADGLEESDTPTPNKISLTPFFRTDYYNGIIAEADYVENVNWLRLRDISLEYSIPTKLIRRQNIIKDASVFATATDVFIITNYSGLDPNVNVLNASTSKGFGGAGIDYGAIPNPRSYNLGIKLNF